mmetsp:Transcript_13367/g.33640  ORF Transcript_13367/g.33640 Transcript_13367/m.33640 type:complete len:392 (+) Transcript_13367:184-1359(+)|eukprot:CAMPEP_0116082808 /NCGR_PEP_ID=MMETSP0327-20121206/2924_1 /TAXON_ID=44447 /ORGANISM="Pseudo-nitzschia delicatissima, Strain B596" /LENGTH=391 /DNA_ID=CAMNT_0003573627 /DNA_START=164 /DNA_END=1339 /DNA_ORIENTATION=-
MVSLRLVLLSHLAITGCHAQGKYQVGTSSMGNGGLRTFMTVEFDYKLEANRTLPGQTANGDDNIFSKYPLQDALQDIETDFIPIIQERLPNGGVPDGKTTPDVQFNTVTSRFINMCFTESETCKWVKTRINLSFVGDRPKAALERATLDLARGYLQDVSDASELIRTTFVYPMIYSSTVQFTFSQVRGAMSDSDIEDLERSFYEVYQAIVGALDGDTDVSEAHFVYQIVTGDSLLVNIKYFGKCRYCSEEELIEIVNGQIEANQRTMLNHVKSHGRSNYFDFVNEVEYSLPVQYVELPPIDAEIMDATAPSAIKRIPWFLYLGAGAAIVVICTGVLVICKDQKELRKEEVSTGSESDSYDGVRHEGADGDVEDNSTLNTNGMHEDYQVYVY